MTDTTSTLDLVISALGPLAQGTITGTIPLALLSFALGLVLALGTALARLSGNAIARGAARVYISIVRGTPLLVQLFIIFYTLPTIGVVIDPFPSAVIAFSLNVGAYAAEAIRAAILSVPQGQWEAAEIIGLSRTTTLRRVILPQALRVAVPPLSNTFISLVKDTSLASSIMVIELLRKAQEIAAPTYEFLALYTLAAAYYWVLCTLLSVLQDYLENRLDPVTRAARTETRELSAAAAAATARNSLAPVA